MMKETGPVSEIKRMVVSSPAFKHGESIPKKYTCQGKNINPPLTISQIPIHTKTLALIVDDPDAPSKTWVHWIVWNIPVSNNIKEESIPGIEGINDFNQYQYGGPCPPSGTHRYFFRVYALSKYLPTNKNITKDELEEIIQPNCIGYGELTGTYKKS